VGTQSKLSKVVRCKLLDIQRSRIYYQAKPETVSNIDLESKIKFIWDEHNFKGSRVIKKELITYQGLLANRKRIQRIMQKLGIKGVMAKINLSKPGDLQYKYPYYLGGMVINHANQVWGTDITYVKLPTGMMYIICLLDLFSRYVVGYIITNTLETSGCLQCLEQATVKHGLPAILNSDQGSQFTSLAWVSALKQQDIMISMDSKGRWADNVYVERFWRTLKRECIYYVGVETVMQLHIEVAKYINWYNSIRLHSALKYKTPREVYLNSRANNQQFQPYCNWPIDPNRLRLKKQIVLPTMEIMEDKIMSG